MARERSRTQQSHSRVAAHSPKAVPTDDHAPLSTQPVFPRPAPDTPVSTPGFLGQRDKQDALVVEEIADCWLHCRWSISQKTLERATSAMGREGHRSTRVLRLFRIEQDDSGPRCKELFEEHEIPPDAEEWFLRVPSTSTAWAVEIGFTFGNARFFSMLHSVPVTLNGSRISLQGAERLLGHCGQFNRTDAGTPPTLQVQGHFLLNGTTRPGTRLSIDDQSIPVDPQTGQFEWQLPLSNGRVVIPINAVNAGRTQRALLAIDLNFHLLEPEPSSDR